MLEFRNHTVQKVVACICDRCQRRMSPEGDNAEWDERLSLSFRGGYGSIFGDGHSVTLDLCQRCVRETLGEWLQISPEGVHELPKQVQRGTEKSVGVPVPRQSSTELEDGVDDSI